MAMFEKILRRATRANAPATQPVVGKVLAQVDKAALFAAYCDYAVTDYATVRDFCDSAERLPDLLQYDGDLKDAQRPWMVKAVIASVAPGARLVEIGGGEPRVAAALTELGYDVTVVDPYDGAGNGPTEYERYRQQYPQVRLVKERFGAHLPLAEASLEAVYSVSVLEHLPAAELDALYAGMRRFLQPGGYSIHCFDSVIEGRDTAYCDAQSNLILQLQAQLAGQTPDAAAYTHLLAALRADLETFYLSAQGHQLWRQGLGQSYDEFPFRKVVSVQTRVRRA